MDFGKLDRFIADYSSENHLSGYLRITCKDKILYENKTGWADIEKEIPFSGASVFSFYSLSKPFLAIGISFLRERGLISLDDHPGKYVPEAKGFDSRVTIRQMLQHISGLPDFTQTARFEEKYATGTPGELRTQLKELARYPMVFVPGTDSMYANVNFIICALAIENVTGIPYGVYMRKNVFEPLGMTGAQVDRKTLYVPNRVQGYELKDGVPCAVERALDWMHGAGDIIGTVDDVYCLNLAIKRRKLLKPESWKEILTPSALNGMGLGCRVSTWHGKPLIQHNGGHRGFRTLHKQLPEEDFDLIYLSNSGWGSAREDISEAVFETFFGSDGSVDTVFKMDEGYI